MNQTGGECLGDNTAHPFGRVQSPPGPRASHATLRIVSYARLQASIKDLCHHTCDESVRVIIKVKFELRHHKL